jgi:hypothetical protein
MFWSFLFFNFFLFLGSVAIIFIAIYMWYMTSTFNGYVEFPLYFGLFLLMLTVCSRKLRKRMHLLRFYLWFVTAFFIILTIFVLTIKFNDKQFKAWAGQIFFMYNNDNVTIDQVYVDQKN